MSDRPEAPETLVAGLRGWLHDGVALVRVRLELFSVEAREHAYALLESLLWGVAAVLLGGLGLGFLAVLITVVLWDSHRVLALTVFAAMFLTLAGVAVWMLKSRWGASQRWLASTLQELAHDEQRLRP